MFGSPWREIIATASLTPGHDLSLDHVIVAERGGERVGMLSGMRTEDMSDPTSAVMRAAGLSVFRAGAVYLAARPILRFMQQHHNGEWYVQGIAVIDASRGDGVGSTLLDLAEQQARAAGSNSLCLDVDTANLGATRLYERKGFATTSTSNRAPLLGGSRVNRMVMTLV